MIKPKIAVIDYKMSNLFSVKHACDFVGGESFITSDKNDIKNADGIILPGVGAFGVAMKNLKKLDLVNLIIQSVEKKKPFMGVCLGMQLLFSQSEEFGIHKGLDLIKGKVVKFPSHSLSKNKIKIPQIGWNKIYCTNRNKDKWKLSPLNNIKESRDMYFVHSYYCCPKNKGDELCKTSYEGIEYCSGVLHNNVFAVQFHPEKSGQVGLKIYKNWINSF